MTFQSDGSQTGFLSGHALHAPACQASARDNPLPTNQADIFKAHVKLNKSEGVMAQVARAAISIPGLMEKVILAKIVDTRSL